MNEDQLEEITESMTYTPPKLGDNVLKFGKMVRTYTPPKLGDNVLKFGKMVRVCSTRGCYQPVFVSEICENGAVRYTCSKHGLRNRQQMDWLDITGSTMIEFRKVGL